MRSTFRISSFCIAYLLSGDWQKRVYLSKPDAPAKDSHRKPLRWRFWLQCLVCHFPLLALMLCATAVAQTDDQALPPGWHTSYELFGMLLEQRVGPISNSSAYSVSKGAVRVFTRALATEIDRSRYPDVLINELLPGVVRTRMSDAGEDPKDVYAHARFVASLPPNGPTGRTFLRSALYIENHGLRARVRRLIARLSLGLVRGE